MDTFFGTMNLYKLCAIAIFEVLFHDICQWDLLYLKAMS